MNDTPQHVKELQMKIWLSKSPAERLKQFMEDNAAMFQFWNKVRKADAEAADIDRESRPEKPSGKGTTSKLA